MTTPYLGTEIMKLSGTVVVTGGNHGLSKAFAFAVAQAGANVAIIYGKEDNATELAKEIQGRFPNIKARAYECDMCDTDRLDQTFQKIQNDKELGGIKGLVTNADTSVIKPALELSHEDFAKVYKTNVLGVFNACRAAARLWINEKQEGSIVVNASMSAQIINQAARNKPLTQAFYNSSLAAARNLVRALAAEWADKRIRVNSVSPGYVDTHESRDQDKDILQHQERNIPLGRFAAPKEVVGQALLLLSQHASYQTGGDYLVDGGQLIW